MREKGSTGKQNERKRLEFLQNPTTTIPLTFQ